jgi:abortive infection bacteriophage resistance protein
MRTTAGLRIYKGMRYNKQPTDITTQLAMLKHRGLIVSDEDMAIKQLASISYFRLASYWKLYETDTATHQFINGTRLEDVVSLYNFDKELRTIIFTAIQDIEVALRTRIIHFFSLEHGAFWFMDATKFNNLSIFNACLENIQNELSRSREEFLQEHFARYDSPSMPPVWKTLEVVSFGNLSKLYANMKDNDVKKKVAKSMGLPKYEYMESWMRSITVLRNCCAHHGRVWNRRYPTMPQMPARLPLAWADTSRVRPMKLYAQLCAILYLEQSIVPNSNIKDKLLKLLADYPQVSVRRMGFPNGWENEPLWQ